MRGDGNLATEQFDASKVLGIAHCFYRKGRKRPDYTTGWKWRIYSAVWTALLPVRRYLLFAYRITLKLKQKK